MSIDRSFVNRRLHSLLGVLPIGLFLMMHLYTNFYLTKGEEAFGEKVQGIWDLGIILPLIEIVLLLTILYHGVYGLYIAFQANNNIGQFNYFRNWMFLLQRVSGIITFVFIFWHVYETRFQVFLYPELYEDPKSLHGMMVEIFTNPYMVAFYVLGVVAAVFHFANGMWAFLISWGVTVGPRAQRFSSFVWLILFLVVSGMGVYTVIYTHLHYST